MKSFRLAAVPIIVCLFWLAIPSTAHAQASCVWGNPAWTEYDSPTGHTVAVNVRCDGGIVGCSGGVKSYLSVFDPLLMQWVPYGTNPRLNTTLYRNCGSNANLADTASNASLPRGTYCCLELQWWEQIGGTYFFMESRQHFFWTP